MDKDKSGILDLDDIKQAYNAKMHPDVKAGKKTEDDILLEFLDTFEAHYSFSHENSRDGRVDMNEWIEYYNNVSMSIDEDKYFEAMMNSAWNLDNSRVTKKGWGGEFWAHDSQLLIQWDNNKTFSVTMQVNFISLFFFYIHLRYSQLYFKSP